MSANIEKRSFYSAALHKPVLMVAGVLFYASLSLSWLPSGLSFQTLRFLSLFMWPVLAILFISSRLNKFAQQQTVAGAARYDVSNLMLGLLPMTPIFRYILANQDIMTAVFTN